MYLLSKRLVSGSQITLKESMGGIENARNAGLKMLTQAGTIDPSEANSWDCFPAIFVAFRKNGGSVVDMNMYFAKTTT